MKKIVGIALLLLMILVLAKVSAHWLLTGLPLVIIAPLLGVFMALPEEGLTVLVLSLLGGTLA